LSAISRGDEGALAALYDRYRLILFGLTLRILHDRQESEDILQETFLQVWRRAGDFDATRGRAFTWLVTIARSRALDRLRVLGSRARLADEVVLTSDNPRSENPERILDDIERGVGDVPHKRIADRRVAIEQAILGASDDDVIVIAGKGHETYQVMGERVVHFDDREEAELALKKRRQNAARKIN